MAFASVGTLGTALSSANNQSSLALTTSAAAEVGNLVVLAIAVDNLATTNGASTAISGVTDSAGNIWTRAVGWAHGGAGVAGGGADISIWYSVIRTQINSAGTITATFSSTLGASAMSAWEFTCAASTRSVGVVVEASDGLVNTAANAGSLNVTTANIACLRVRAIASESNSTTALTPTASWAIITQAVSGAGTSISEMGVRGEWIISTATGAASAPTGGAGAVDHASAYVAFKELAAPTFGGIQPSDLPIRRARIKKAAAFALIVGSALHGPLSEPPPAPETPFVAATTTSTGLQFARRSFYQGSAVGPLEPPTVAAEAVPAATQAGAKASGLQFSRLVFYQGAARGPLDPPPGTYQGSIDEPTTAAEVTDAAMVVAGAIDEPTTAADASAALAVLANAITEPAAASETVNAGAIVADAIAEPTAATDAAVASHALAAAATEAASAADSSASAAVLADQVAEPASAADTVAGSVTGEVVQQYARAGAQSAGLQFSRKVFYPGPSFVIGPANVVHSDSVSEVASAADSSASAAVLADQVAEPASAADTVSAAVVGETVTQYVIGGAHSSGPQFSKRSLVRHAWSFGVPISTTYSENISEAAAAVDAVSGAVTGETQYPRSGARSSGIRFSRAFYQGLTSEPALLVPAGNVVTGNIAEAASAADTVTAATVTTAAIAEAAAATDTVNGVRVGGAAISEAGSATETVAAARISVPSITEAAAAVDTVATGAGGAVGAIVEAASATDTVVGRGTFQHAVSEAATATDVYSSTGAVKSVAIIEALTTAETVAARATYPNTLAEAASATDSVTGLARRLGAVAEAAAATDAATVSAVFLRTLTETVSATDTAAAASIFSRNVIEAATATAAQTAGAILGGSISEPAAALDISTGARLVAAIVLEPGAAADELTGDMQPPRQKPPSGGRPVKPDKERPRTNEPDADRRVNTADSGRRGTDGT